MNYYVKCLKQYVDFNGRARRMEFWMFALINAIIGGVLTLIHPAVGYVYYLAVFLPNLAVTARRLHDINKSGWWMLITLVPFIGGIWLIVLTLMDSKPGENQYGPNPKGM